MENSTPNASAKQSKAGYLATIIVLALTTAGLLVALLVVLLSRGNCSCADDQSEETISSGTGTAIDNLLRAQRNTQREDDISRFMTAANDFQVNNAGKTPWTSGGKTNDKWVPRYVDKDCSYDYSIGGTEYYACDAGSTEFRDPDGVVYRINYIGAIDKNYNLNNVMKNWPNNHELVVATNAMCGDDGLLEVGYSSRQFAMAYRLEGGSIACNDNH